MPLSPETARRLTGSNEGPDSREVRIRFESHTALLEALALADDESWIEECRVAFSDLELIIRMAGGFSIDPCQGAAPRQTELGGATFAGQA